MYIYIFFSGLKFCESTILLQSHIYIYIYVIYKIYIYIYIYVSIYLLIYIYIYIYTCLARFSRAATPSTVAEFPIALWDFQHKMPEPNLACMVFSATNQLGVPSKYRQSLCHCLQKITCAVLIPCNVQSSFACVLLVKKRHVATICPKRIWLVWCFLLLINWGAFKSIAKACATAYKKIAYAPKPNLACMVFSAANQLGCLQSIAKACATAYKRSHVLFLIPYDVLIVYGNDHQRSKLATEPGAG